MGEQHGQAGQSEDGLSPSDDRPVGAQCSLNEWVVLALLGEGPNHGFSLAKELSPGTDLGRVLTVRRPLVYRALDRSVDRGFAVPYQTEPGDSGPTRTVHRVTDVGDALTLRWLVEPVNHIRDVRVEFLVKLRLMERRGLSASVLISAQRAALTETIDGLTNRQSNDADADVVDHWRAENARAVARFLDQLDM
jgi:PadR family transcriptional regulator AphA